MSFSERLNPVDWSSSDVFPRDECTSQLYIRREKDTPTILGDCFPELKRLRDELAEKEGLFKYFKKVTDASLSGHVLSTVQIELISSHNGQYEDYLASYFQPQSK